MITKTAEVVLNPHQQRVLDKLDKQPGVIAFHSLGSGKTITSLSAAKKQMEAHPDKKVLFVVPASLVDNVYKEINKHSLDIDKNKLQVVSYEKAVRDIENLKKEPHSLIVADEAHRLRNNDTKRAAALRTLLSSADKRLLLSGTINYNQLADAARLVNLAAADKILPDTDKEFNATFIGEKQVKPGIIQRWRGVEPGVVQYLKNKKRLGNALSSYVDHYDAMDDMQHLFPKSTVRRIQVEMNPEQRKYYNFVMDELPPSLRLKIEAGLPLSKKEMASFNNFATGVRQVSDSISPYVGRPTLSPKIYAAAKSMVDAAKGSKKFRGVAYSNYLEAGLAPYKKYLESKGVHADMFTGALSKKEKKALVDSYNNTDDSAPRVLLLSSSGGEGLDLKGTRKLQVLEPHFNQSKINQVVGRGIRYKSHEHLPEEERNVDVEHYFTTYPRTFMNKVFKTKPQMAIDEYLDEASNRKAQLGKQMEGLFIHGK